jgi:hypothetical protein
MYTRRRHRRNLDSVTIGRFAGEESTTENTVSVGRKAGYSVQKQYAIAIGDRAGEEAQDLNAIAIGANAGAETQSTKAIALGDQAGQTSQGANSIAIGSQSGQLSQGAKAIAIGENAGKSSQGANSIAIGANAGSTNQTESSIIICTSNGEIVAKKKGLYIAPIRNADDRAVDNGNILSYLYETKEVVTGFPRLPRYPNDSDVNQALSIAVKDTGTLYYDTTRMRVKVYNGTAWIALADVGDLILLGLAPGAIR